MNLASNRHLTQATSADLDELARLINSAYRGDESRLGWTTEADLLGGQRTDAELLSSELSTHPNRTILCLREECSGPILGCVFLEKIQDAQGETGCYLGMLTVKPHLQNQGFGKYLLQASEDFARAWGATFMTLGVIHARETLMAWYERHGYQRTGQTKPFPASNPRTGIPQRDDLHFILFRRKI